MLSSREVIHALANAFSGVSPRGDIHQPLVRSSVLKHSFYFPLHGQKNGAFVLLQLNKRSNYVHKNILNYLM